MKTCLKCGGGFPVTKKVGNKILNFSNRLYCFECSPYKSRNTLQLHICSIVEGSERVCKRCEKPYVYRRGTGATHCYCPACQTRNRHIQVKLRCIAYKGGKCVICGYNKCASAMEFHHIDKTTKSFTIGGNQNRSWEYLRKELDKCVLLCANHHAEVESGVTNLPCLHNGSAEVLHTLGDGSTPSQGTILVPAFGTSI